MTVIYPLSIHFVKEMIDFSNDCSSTSLTVKRYRVRYQHGRWKRMGREGRSPPSFQQSLVYKRETDNLLTPPPADFQTFRSFCN